jgi:hypothetical protein
VPASDVHQLPDLFDFRALGPPPDAQPLSAGRRDWRRHARWLRSHHRPARVVIVTGEIAVAYIALVLGVLFGAGLQGIF